MSLNRTILLTIAIALLLGAVFYTASLWPLGDMSNAQPDAASASTASPANDTSPAAESNGTQSADGDTAGQDDSTTGADDATTVDESPSAITDQDSGTGDSAADDFELGKPESGATDDDRADNDTTENSTTENSTTETNDVKIYTFEIINSYPHDPEAFTQGLIWHDGLLYEGTGLRGRSSLRKVSLADGAVEQRIELSDEHFGEGITIFGERIYQLTWQANIGFVYDLNTFEELSTFNYPTEGWGITHDGKQLIMSDGSSTIYFWDPETLAQIGSIDVTLNGQPVEMLNELEYINGFIYANVWQTDWIVIIDPATGVVNEMINLAGLLQLPDGYQQRPDVLNGIAYDSETERLFVTGKLWPQLYEIELVESNQQLQ